jgi:SAM-dependent methyltransferase
VDPRAEELAAVIDEIRQRVRARHPNGSLPGDVPLADLTPMLRARDAAEAKVASIGTVNPRSPGLVNSIAQFLKRQISRGLDWHVREQVEFNRAAVQCVQSAMDAMNDFNRALVALSARIDDQARTAEELRDEARELQDIRTHWYQWRKDWEHKLAINETHFLRGLAESQAAFHHRVTLMDSTFKDHIKLQHRDFEGALDRATNDIQKRLWADLDQIRTDYETVIHAELRLHRQKATLARDAERLSGGAPADFSSIDWLKFAEKFRGSEDYVREHARMYAERFQGCSNVLDVGCGRGELLETLRAAGIGARGIDLNDDSIALCRSRGLEVEKADLFSYLDGLPDASLDGVVCCQVVEHLPHERLPELIRLAQAKLRAGATIAIETPNPECLAIFATHFFLDPTHQRPIPPLLMAFYLEEAGLGRIEIERLHPALETMPSLASLPEDFRNDFFGALDYSIFAKKLG